MGAVRGVEILAFPLTDASLIQQLVATAQAVIKLEIWDRAQLEAAGYYLHLISILFERTKQYGQYKKIRLGRQEIGHILKLILNLALRYCSLDTVQLLDFVRSCVKTADYYLTMILCVLWTTYCFKLFASVFSCSSTTTFMFHKRSV